MKMQIPLLLHQLEQEREQAQLEMLQMEIDLGMWDDEALGVMGDIEELYHDDDPDIVCADDEFWIGAGPILR